MIGPALAQFDLFTAQVSKRDSRVTVIASDRDTEFRAHLRNTGRLENLIYPGVTITCEWKESGKTDARVIGAVDGGAHVLLDTYVQEKSFGKILEDGLLKRFSSDLDIKSQVSFEGKRFDFGIKPDGKTGYIELKSAVTCKSGWASYPDAPSERGLEHLDVLERISREGHPAYVVFTVTHPDCDRFRPNGDVQPEMVARLQSAEEAGVDIFAVKMVITEEGKVLLSNSDVPVSLQY